MFRLTRKSYLGDRKTVKNDFLKAEWVIEETDRGVVVIAFSGKRNNPDIYVRYRNMDRAEKSVIQWLDSLLRNKEYREEKAAKKKATMAAGHGVKPGDVYSASWGYDQTNVDWYKIVSVTKAMAVVVKIACAEKENSYMSGVCRPVDRVIGEPKRVRLIPDEPGGKWSFRATECSTASYEEKGYEAERYFSSYA